MTPNARLILSSFNDANNWLQLREDAATMAQRTDRMWFVIGKSRASRIHDSRDPIPYEMRIDWVAFPRRRYGQG
jgi:hypothetical protein